jgi:hypothetical protein
MKAFDEVSAIYSDIDNTYAVAEANARIAGDQILEQGMQKKRELNDLAFFLFLFTRFEGHINMVVEGLVTSKFGTLKRWSDKRTWGVLKGRQLAFMDRIALLTPSGHSDYNLVKKYYDQRNNIAHGQAFTIPINIPSATADFKRLTKILK